jgi:hypothetical protein
MNTVLQNDCRNTCQTKTYKFKEGDHCRISFTREAFHKRFEETHTEELFIIHKRLKTFPITYKLKDLQEHVLDGVFFMIKSFKKWYREKINYTILKQF